MHTKHMLIGGGGLLVLLLVLGVPVASALPYALVLACPLMMLFMMRGMHGGMHGGHGGHGQGPSSQADSAETDGGRSETTERIS